jgi:hypothetical protein
MVWAPGRVWGRTMRTLSPPAYSDDEAVLRIP